MCVWVFNDCRILACLPQALDVSLAWTYQSPVVRGAMKNPDGRAADSVFLRKPRDAPCRIERQVGGKAPTSFGKVLLKSYLTCPQGDFAAQGKSHDRDTTRINAGICH